MSRQIEDELKLFTQHMKSLRNIMDIEESCDYAYTLVPKKKPVSTKAPKRLALTVSGIVHGNETVGIAAINEFLHLLLNETIDCRIPLGIFLGNIPAAKANQRYLERDLNRSFDRQGKTAEERRAKDLSSILADTIWYLDIHQTNRPAEEPFFIFPYAKDSFFFAQNLSAHTAIVTHIGSNFSNDGLCTDEFVNRKAGIGLTLECGKAGFDPLQIGFALKTIMHSVRFVQSMLEAHRPPHPIPAHEKRKIFVVRDTISCPQTGPVKLAENLSNLQPIKKGDYLATVNGTKIVSTRDGRIVFPNYAAETREPGKRPAELMRIIEPILPADLPK